MRRLEPDPRAEQVVTAAVAGVSVMTVTGDDAPAFLQGQLANDVTGMADSAALRSLYLNHKGHAIAEVMVLRRGRKEFDLVEEGGAAAWVKAELLRHVIFDQVQVGDPRPAALVSVQGEGAPAVLEAAFGLAAPAPFAMAIGTTPAGEKLAAWARKRSEVGGYDLLVEGAPDAAATLLQALEAAGARHVGPAGLDLLRVRALAALAPQDAGEGVLPQEAGLEEALSYRKGCYLGQEIMARIEARGKLRRGLVRLRFDADPRVVQVAGAGQRELRSQGRVVGLLGTVVDAGDGFEALAVLRRDLPEGERVVAAGDVEALVVAPSTQ